MQLLHRCLLIRSEKILLNKKPNIRKWILGLWLGKGCRLRPLTFKRILLAITFPALLRTKMDPKRQSSNILILSINQERLSIWINLTTRIRPNQSANKCQSKPGEAPWKSLPTPTSTKSRTSSNNRKTMVKQFRCRIQSSSLPPI